MHNRVNGKRRRKFIIQGNEESVDEILELEISIHVLINQFMIVVMVTCITVIM